MAIRKTQLRQRMRAVRADVTDRAGLSRRIAQRLLEAPHEHAEPCLADNLMWFIYVSHGDEVETHGLIRDRLERGRAVAVPRITGEATMVAQRIASFGALRPGRFGILAPTGDGAVVQPDVCVLPCLAVTASGERMGMGGGYYDRYLAAHPDTVTIVPAFDEQVIDTIPTEPHDRRVDWIVTPTRTIRCAT